ncbi:hypothetical protein AB1E18_002651 [Capra hircus]
MFFWNSLAFSMIQQDTNASSAASQADRQPVMGPCSEDPHLCGASRLLGFTSLLLSIHSTGRKSSGVPGPGAQDSVAHCQEAEPWGFSPESNYKVLLRVSPGADTPAGVSLQDKYQQRVHVPTILSLRFENLTFEDKPMTLPQILFKSSSVTPNWYDVTQECKASENREDLKATWESKSLPRELEWRRTLGPAANSWSLPVSLPLNQPSASLTWVVSNPGDQKTATSDLGEVCSHGPCGCAVDPGRWAVPLKGMWMRKEMETEKKYRVQEDRRDRDGATHCAKLSQGMTMQFMSAASVPCESLWGLSVPQLLQELSVLHPWGMDEQHLEDKKPLTTVYSEAHKPGRQAIKII